MVLDLGREMGISGPIVGKSTREMGSSENDGEPYTETENVSKETKTEQSKIDWSFKMNVRSFNRRQMAMIEFMKQK